MSSVADRTKRVVRGALLDTIHSHGAITERGLDSAAKRVVAQLRSAADCQAKIVGLGDEHARCRAATEAAHKRTEKMRFAYQRLSDMYEREKARNQCPSPVPLTDWSADDRALMRNQMVESMRAVVTTDDSTHIWAEGGIWHVLAVELGEWPTWDDGEVVWVPLAEWETLHPPVG